MLEFLLSYSTLAMASVVLMGQINELRPLLALCVCASVRVCMCVGVCVCICVAFNV